MVERRQRRAKRHSIHLLNVMDEILLLQCLYFLNIIFTL
jgi:hypothetical protein